MTKYAANTNVAVAKSKMEIERTVTRYGAHGFSSGWHGHQAHLQFIIGKDATDQRVIRFVMTLPSRDDKAFTEFRQGYTTKSRTESSAVALWEQACRQKWRALALLVKAKLEAVDAGIATIEESFFADIVMPDGRTVYETARENVAIAYQNKQNLPLLEDHSR